MLEFAEMPKEEYIVFKEEHISKKPEMMVLPQTYPEEIYVATKRELPFVVKLFVGGLSVVGLYMVYRFIERAKRKK
jgi:hypothetical protein